MDFAPRSDSTTDVTIFLNDLYKDDPRERERFGARFQEFMSADPEHEKVITSTGQQLRYPHKSWIPGGESGRPALLMLFGNPAPHSVREEVYFAYEGVRKEHRFWRVLRELEICSLDGTDSRIKERFLSCDYASRFRLGLEVLVTFPTSASHTKWGGVAGFRRLFGARASRILLAEEQRRMHSAIRGFLGKNGKVIAFQRDAYVAVASDGYCLNKATQGTLRSVFEGCEVFGVPPTRWLYSAKMKDVLRQIVSIAAY